LSFVRNELGSRKVAGVNFSLRKSLRSKRRWLKYAIPALVLYVILTSGLFLVMLQPPTVFGHVMSKLPSFSYFLFPFEPLWLVARRGTLKVGDMAPDFSLKKSDRSAEVRLSSFRQQKPVVLIFGSHT
jgi:hypothetical protein